MSRPVIITCAITGSTPTPAVNPAVPVTPQEIAESSIGAAKAGASIVHIHVRDPGTGQPSTEFELYKEVVERIRDSGQSVLINLTTGPGARFVHSLENPIEPLPGTTLRLPEERIDHIVRLRPDICSLDFATMNRKGFSFINIPEYLGDMMTSVVDAGVKPEIEVFDGGHIELFRDMVDSEVLAQPHFVQLCLGVKWGMPATETAVAYLVSRLPENCVWSAFGISKHWAEISQSALDLGGHLRVGFEDNIYVAAGVLAESNAQLVDQAIDLVKKSGHRPATVAETRKLLRLHPN